MFVHAGDEEDRRLSETHEEICHCQINNEDVGWCPQAPAPAQKTRTQASAQYCLCCQKQNQPSQILICSHVQKNSIQFKVSLKTCLKKKETLEEDVDEKVFALLPTTDEK